MKFQNISTLLIVCVVFGIVFSHTGVVDATRVLLGSGPSPGGPGHGTKPPVDPYTFKAKESVKPWLENLGSGPSPGGPGHGTKPPAHVA